MTLRDVILPRHLYKAYVNAFMTDPGGYSKDYNYTIRCHKVRSAALSRKNYRDLDLNSCIGQVLKIKGKWRRTATLRLCNESDEDIPDNVYFVWYNGSKKQVSSMYVVPDCGDPVHVLSLAWY